VTAELDAQHAIVKRLDNRSAAARASDAVISLTRPRTLVRWKRRIEPSVCS
jgi:hypothetical protein